MKCQLRKFLVMVILLGKLKEKSEIEMFHWSAKQAYIALGNALTACAVLNIDSTPMEGFEPEEVNKLPRLK